MAKTKKQTTKQTKSTETDSSYLLKLVLYIIVGSQWLFLQTRSGGRIPLPVGLIIGLLFAMHDHFRIDRKVEYAVLLVAMLFGYLANVGLFVGL